MSQDEFVPVGPQHMPDGIALPIHGPDVARAEPELIAQLERVSAATAAAGLHRMGVRQSFIAGPVARLPGSRTVGTAVTLQFMPQREDIASGMEQEHAEKVSALWRVLDEIRPGDVLVVQAYGDPYTGCLGEMLDHLPEGARRRRAGGGRLHPRLAQGALHRPAAVDRGGDPALRLAGHPVPVGLQRAGRRQPGAGAAGRHRDRR